MKLGNLPEGFSGGKGAPGHMTVGGKDGRPANARTVSTKQARIASLAKQMPETAIRSLSHHMDLEWLREAYRRTRKDGAVGVDDVTAEEFAVVLDANLQGLLE